MSEHEIKKNNVIDFQIHHKEQFLTLYCFKDLKLSKFMPPFFAISDDEAVRNASNIVNYSNSLICKFPEDYVLYKVGQFSETQGIIISVEPTLVTHCDILKTPESKKFDDLLKEVEQQRSLLSSLHHDVDNFVKSSREEFNNCKKSFNDLENSMKAQEEYASSICKDIHDKYKSIELYEPQERKEEKFISKVVDFLFGSKN